MPASAGNAAASTRRYSLGSASARSRPGTTANGRRRRSVRDTRGNGTSVLCADLGALARHVVPVHTERPHPDVVERTELAASASTSYESPARQSRPGDITSTSSQTCVGARALEQQANSPMLSGGYGSRHRSRWKGSSLGPYRELVVVVLAEPTDEIRPAPGGSAALRSSPGGGEEVSLHADSMQHDVTMVEPVVSRPYMPGYGVVDADQGAGLLPWSSARERLRGVARLLARNGAS